MISAEVVYIWIAILFATICLRSALDETNPRRLAAATFWGIAALLTGVGPYLRSISSFGVGCLVIALTILAWIGLGKSNLAQATAEQRQISATRFGNALFLPALLIPVLTLVGTFVLPALKVDGSPLFVKNDVTLIALCVASVIAVLVGLILVRESPVRPFLEGARLTGDISWPVLLPTLLASLGLLFKLAGIGDIVADLLSRWFSLEIPWLAIMLYFVGMALFTILLGNAFAAFPVMLAAVGLPILVHKLGANPAAVAALGMLSGFCGTLMTPMAANFNIVPARLLDLQDDYAVIRVQIPTGLLLLAANMVIMYLFGFNS